MTTKPCDEDARTIRLLLWIVALAHVYVDICDCVERIKSRLPKEFNDGRTDGLRAGDTD